MLEPLPLEEESKVEKKLLEPEQAGPVEESK